MMCSLPFIENSRVAALLTFYDSFFAGTTQGFADYRNILAKGAYKNMTAKENKKLRVNYGTGVVVLPEAVKNSLPSAKKTDIIVLITSK